MIVKELRVKYNISQAELSAKTGIPRGRIAQWELGKGNPKVDDYNKMVNFFSELGEVFEKGISEGDKLRQQKATEGSKKDSLKGVPIKAQAGYSMRHMDPLFINDLLPFDIPGLPYAGDRYRAFEISGDSMEYYNEQGLIAGLSEGMWVIGERIDPDYWHQTTQYYVHVLITEDRIMIKRLYRKGEWYVCISDNTHNEQFLVHKNDLRELWVVKRKIDWDMPPPRKIEIDIEIPE